MLNGAFYFTDRRLVRVCVQLRYKTVGWNVTSDDPVKDELTGFEARVVLS